MPLMTNAEAFRYDFGIYATELWAMTEAQFLEWLNADCDKERPNAVPVVRCKDCKWFRFHKTALWCEKERGLNYPQYDSFCSWGERREDD